MRLPPDTTPELELRDRIVAGDREAAEAFFRRHLDSLFEFVHYRVGGDRALTEDIVQDTLLVALERLAGFDGRSSLHTWMCGIAKNKIRTTRRQRRPALIEDVLAAADPEIDLILAEIDRTEIPESLLEKQETQELVGATLSSLSPDYREVLLDKYVDGLSVHQIADKRGRGSKATESSLQRARAAFAKVFSLLAKTRGGNPT